MVALGERSAPNGQELLAEFIQYGNQKPFEEIVRRYAGMVFNVCFRITKDKHEAEDAVQAVFLTLALQAKRGAEIKALGPWLQQVAKRLALDVRRSKKRRKTREERHHAEQTVRRESILGDTLPSADLDELKTVLHEELQKLPAKYRMPLILHYFGGLTRDEMAAELNCKASTLGVRIFRGREMLAGRLSGRSIHISSAALAALLGYAVKRAVSDTLIASTSYAATAMMAGHDGSGIASAHVIGLTRRATNAVMFTKIKTAAMTLLIAGSSLGAGAKALQLLPTINIQHILTDQLKKLMEPLMQPLSRPLMSQAPTRPASPIVTASGATGYVPPLMAQPTSVVAPAIAKAAGPKVEIAPAVPPMTIASNTAPAASDLTPPYLRYSNVSASPPAKDDSKATPAAVVADESSAASAGMAAGGGSGMGAGGAEGYAAAIRANYSSPIAGRSSDISIQTNNMVVGSASTTAVASPKVVAMPAAEIQVPAVGGTVTETSTGLLRGWGTIQKTGTLQVNGQIVADGSGVDRTLNLSAFSAVETASIGTGLAPSTATTSTVDAPVGPICATLIGAAKNSINAASCCFECNRQCRYWQSHGVGIRCHQSTEQRLVCGKPRTPLLGLTGIIHRSKNFDLGVGSRCLIAEFDQQCAPRAGQQSRGDRGG